MSFHDDIDEEADDPFLEAELDRALAPYLDKLPPDMIQHYRELLGDVLTTHPLGRRLLNRARPRQAPETSTGNGEGESEISERKGGRSA